jgi:hypothetical protein
MAQYEEDRSAAATSINSVQAVFDILELREAIILSLDWNGILTRAALVCQTWYKTIQNSLVIRTKLCIPSTQTTVVTPASWTRLTRGYEMILSPPLSRSPISILPPPFPFNLYTDDDKRPLLLRQLAFDFSDRQCVLSEFSSCLSMYITSPVCTAMVVGLRYPPNYVRAQDVAFLLDNPDGITYGEVLKKTKDHWEALTRSYERKPLDDGWEYSSPQKPIERLYGGVVHTFQAD